MATVNLTTTPTQIDSGTGGSLFVVNTGAVEVEFSRAQSATKAIVSRLRPGQNDTIFPEGAAVTAAAVSATGSISLTTTAKAATPIEAAATQLVTTFAPITARSYFRGVNFSGLEFANGLPTAVPGTLPSSAVGSAAAYAEIVAGTAHFSRLLEADFTYFGGIGLNLIRIPFNWERLQPLLKTALDTTYLGYIQEAVTWAAAHGCQVILDLHNFGARYVYPATAGVSGVKRWLSEVETDPLPVSALVDVWTRLVKVFAGNSAVFGYDLMNEPNGMLTRLGYGSPQTANTSVIMHQACIDAIRHIDSQKWIICEIENASGFQQWMAYYGNSRLTVPANGVASAVTATATEEKPFLNDPAGRLMLSAHYYMDFDQTGAYTTAWQQVCRDRIPGDLKPMLDWCQRYGIPVLVGEIGVPDVARGSMAAGDVAKWQTDIQTCLTIFDSYPNVYVTGWNAGPVPSATPFEPRDGSGVIDYTATNYQSAYLVAHPGTKVAPLSAGGSGEEARTRGGLARPNTPRWRRPADDPNDTTRGGYIASEQTFGYDTIMGLGRWLIFRDLAGTELGKLFATDSTQWLPATRIASATGPEWYAEAQTRIGARSGANLSLPAEILARAYFRTGVSVSPSAGVVTLNCSSGSLFYVNMNANVTSWAFSNNPNIDGAEFEVHFIQDGTGSRTLAGANGLIRFPGGTAPTLTTTAGKRDIFKFTYSSGGTFCQNSAAAMAVNAG